jgi:hypothetical protein
VNRDAELRLIMTGIAAVCGLAAGSAVWPVLDAVMTAGLLGALGLAVAGYLGRELVRELRFRADMRALDARDAARAAATIRVGVHR